MLRGKFNLMCAFFATIASKAEPQRTKELNEFMSMGFMFLELTDKQAKQLKSVLKKAFPDKYIEYAEPDEHGFTAEFEYLRFK